MRKQTLTSLSWMLPAVVFLLVVIIYPLFFSLRASFTSWYGVIPVNLQFIGLENYKKNLLDSDFLITTRNTLYFVSLAVALQFIIGLGLALLLNRSLKCKNGILTILLTPLAISPIATSLIWRGMYEPRMGIINSFLKFYGLPTPLWLADPSLALFALVIADTWQWTPFVMLLCLSGLEALPKAPYEAAQLDGASSLQTFLHITLPLLKPVIGVALLFRTMEAFKVFDLVYMCTFGGPGASTQVFSFNIYKLGLTSFRVGLAAAYSYFLLIIILVISTIYIKILVGSSK